MTKMKTIHDDFQHFLSYSGNGTQPPPIVALLFKAFEAAWEPARHAAPCGEVRERLRKAFAEPGSLDAPAEVIFDRILAALPQVAVAEDTKDLDWLDDKYSQWSPMDWAEFMAAAKSTRIRHVIAAARQARDKEGVT